MFERFERYKPTLAIQVSLKVQKWIFKLNFGKQVISPLIYKNGDAVPCFKGQELNKKVMLCKKRFFFALVNFRIASIKYRNHSTNQLNM